MIFDTHIIVDWSARSKPSPARPTKGLHLVVRGQRRHCGQPQVRQNSSPSHRPSGRRPRRRTETPTAAPWSDSTFPSAIRLASPGDLTGRASALALWDWLDDRIEDARDNGNNRYEVAQTINRAYPRRRSLLGPPGEAGCIPMCQRANPLARGQDCPSTGTSSSPIVAPKAPRPSGNWPTPGPSDHRCCWDCRP